MKRNSYKWRPNDNSSKTKLKYQLETKHWLDAIKSEQSLKSSPGELFQMFGIAFGLVTTIPLVIFYGIQAIYRFFFPKEESFKKFLKNVGKQKLDNPWDYYHIPEDKIDEVMRKANERIKIQD